MESQSQIKATEEEEAYGRDEDNSAKEHSKEEYGGGVGAHKEIVTEKDKNITPLKQSLLEQKVQLRKRGKCLKVEKPCMKYKKQNHTKTYTELGICLLTLNA